MLFGALAGVVSALAGLLLSWWIGRLEPPSVVRARRTVTRDLPLAADLLAACAAVGHPPTHSLRTVAAAVDGPLGATLNGLVARLELGADPYLEWRRISEDEGLGQLGRTMLRTLESGAPLVDSLIRLADDSRREWRGQMQEQARQVGVRAAAPLAACFLPSFMLVGVVPTVVSALSGLGFAR